MENALTTKEKYAIMENTITYEPTNRNLNERMFRMSFLSKSLQMFEYTGLPIPFKELELILQLEGKAFIQKRDNRLIAYSCEYLFDDVDEYGNAMNVTCRDKLNHSTFTASIGEGVLIKNDFLSLGLARLYAKYAYLLTDSAITLRLNNLWKRSSKVFVANDDPTMESVKAYIADVEAGKPAAIAATSLFEALKVYSDDSRASSVKDLIEYDNYLRKLLYSEIGIFTPQVKKERMITSEVESSGEILFPFIDNMLEEREKALELLNFKYDLNAEVAYNSIWKKRQLGELVESATTRTVQGESLDYDGTNMLESTMERNENDNNK